MEHQNLEIKIQNCQYAFQSYNHLLIMIKDAMRSGNFNCDIFITTMHNVDNYVTDNTPIVDKYFKKYDAKFNVPSRQNPNKLNCAHQGSGPAHRWAWLPRWQMLIAPEPWPARFVSFLPRPILNQF